MKKIFFSTLFLFFYTQVIAQTVVVTDDAAYTSGQASSVLDVKSITKGFLTPRMTQAQRLAITSPTDGLLVYQTDLSKGFYNYNATTALWVPLSASAGTQWSLSGNTGTAYPTNFLGSIDKIPLSIKTNNIERIRVDTSGSIGIGSSNFDATNRDKVLIDAGTTLSTNAVTVIGRINNFFQLNIKNTSPGTGASTDLIATADNGTQSNNYVDLGINSSGYNTAGNVGKPDDGYLISQANDFYFENLNAAKDFIFATGTQKEIMRLTGTGHLGIGINNPRTQLVIKDTIEIRRVSPVAVLTFTNTAGSGDMKITGDGGDIFWQGGGGRALQMGSYWTTFIGGDRLTSSALSFINGSYLNTGTIIQSQRDPSVALAVLGNSGTQTANLMEWRNSAGTVYDIVDKSGNMAVGTPTVNGANKLTVSGSVSAAAFNVSSDRRLKMNIKDLNYGLHEILALRPVLYNWKDPTQTPSKQIGLIAQETKKIIPEVVSGNEKNGKLSINYTELLPVLINAIKEQQKEIDELKSKIKKLQELH